MKQLTTLCLLCIFALTSFAQNDSVYQKVYFDFDKYVITSESEATLQTLLQDKRTILEVFVEANTDHRGSVEYNIKLGQNRANAVKDYLTNFGITKDLITILNHGETKPLFENETEDGMAKNRRVDILVIYQEQKEVVQVERKVQPHYGFLANNDNDVFDFYEEMKPESEKFIISNLRDTFLVTKTGTVIEIPAKSFNCNCDETLFEVEIDEAITFKQMIQHGFVTTDEEGNPLQTGGMVDIKAFSFTQRKPVRLDKEITLNIPSEKPMNDMNYYIGDETTVSEQNETTEEVVTRNETRWSVVEGSAVGVMTWNGTNNMREPCCEEKCIVKETERRVNYWKRHDSEAYFKYLEGLELARKEMKERCDAYANRNNAFDQSVSNQSSATGRTTRKYYVLSTPRLGQVNVDRLMKMYQDQELVTVTTTIPVDKAVDYFYISKSKRFIIRAISYNRFLRVPKGEEITILGFGMDENNQPLAAMLEIQAEDKTYDLEFFEVSNDELDKVLDALN